MATVNITFDDNYETICVRVGRMVEYIDVEFKSKGQIFDAVKYALISKDATLSDIEITDILHRIGAA